jgi:hypothetical protein
MLEFEQYLTLFQNVLFHSMIRLLNLFAVPNIFVLLPVLVVVLCPCQCCLLVNAFLMIHQPWRHLANRTTDALVVVAVVVVVVVVAKIAKNSLGP